MRHVEETEKTKGIAIGSLAMSAALALIKAQFGSPLGMAQAVLSKIQARKAPVAAIGMALAAGYLLSMLMRSSR